LTKPESRFPIDFTPGPGEGHEVVVLADGTTLTGRKADVFAAFAAAGEVGAYTAHVTKTTGLLHPNATALTKALLAAGLLEPADLPAGASKKVQYYRATQPVAERRRDLTDKEKAERRLEYFQQLHKEAQKKISEESAELRRRRAALES
jgi:hypothetical protein